VDVQRDMAETVELPLADYLERFRSAYMYAYVHIYTHLNVYVYICICTCICMCICICICTCTCTGTCTCTRIGEVYIHTFMYKNVILDAARTMIVDLKKMVVKEGGG